MTSAMELHDIQAVAFGLVGKTVAYAFTTYFVLALIDYLYERWKFERSLRMTKEEIREESRESEGDPLIKAKIRSMQRDMARRRMMEAVPKATVVITNPTHIAVALLYKKDQTSAPKVIAKGKGYVAERIREIARKHGVPLVEDKPLARALFKVKLDSFIPEDLYRAVAKILAYIYKLKGAAA
jgi:flagellar biosynthetic protein FlhB